MKNALRDTLKTLQEQPGRKESHLHAGSDLKLLTDEEIAEVIGKRAERLRKKLEKKQGALNIPQTTYSKFANSGQISLVALIKVLRGLGRLGDLDAVLKFTVEDELAEIKTEKKHKQRVR